MTFSTKRQTVTYVVRIWAEYLDESPPRWCGAIESVGGGGNFFFAHLDEIVAIIQENTSTNHTGVKK